MTGKNWVFYLKISFRALLIAADKFMPEIHIRQPGFAYSACRNVTKHKEIIKKFNETEVAR